MRAVQPSEGAARPAVTVGARVYRSLPARLRREKQEDTIKHRSFAKFLPSPLYDPTKGMNQFNESASTDLIIERLRRHAEIADIGRNRFSGTLGQRNVLWKESRNYLLQALSNYSAAMQVPNRSACLLYYYALLNFAKSELLETHAPDLINQPIGHGLSFNPTNARTVRGDFLTVRKGVFPLLYERRTGHRLPTGTKLPISRLISHIPEIGLQAKDAGLSGEVVCGILQLILVSNDAVWPLLGIFPSTMLDGQRSTLHTLNQHFRRVDHIENWKDIFAISKRWGAQAPAFFESIETAPLTTPRFISPNDAMRITWKIRDILALTTIEQYDGFLVPYMYKTRKFAMPPSLARYAVMYYASSLVRYKPSMFDPSAHPAQAHLFDAIARECKLPMLIDTLSAIEGRGQIFYSDGTYRL